jgi:hypothetical protein
MVHSIDDVIKNLKRYMDFLNNNRQEVVMTTKKETYISEPVKVTNVSAPEPLPVPAPPQTLPALEPTMLSILIMDRDSKIEQARIIDGEIEKLDAEIRFLQRHPESEVIIKRLAERLNASVPAQSRPPESQKSLTAHA